MSSLLTLASSGSLAGTGEGALGTSRGGLGGGTGAGS
jgi:hypothetical protein